MLAVMRSFFSWFGLGGRFRREDFGPTEPIDPRTEVIPLHSGHRARTYFEVADEWAGERLRVRRILADVLAGDRPVATLRAIASDSQCFLGMWLRFLPPNRARARAVAELRKWHGAWHDGVQEGIDRYLAGDVEFLRRMITQRAGSWYHAGRQVSVCLEAIWMA